LLFPPSSWLGPTTAS